MKTLYPNTNECCVKRRFKIECAYVIFMMTLYPNTNECCFKQASRSNMGELTLQTKQICISDDALMFLTKIVPLDIFLTTCTFIEFFHLLFLFLKMNVVIDVTCFHAG